MLRKLLHLKVYKPSTAEHLEWWIVCKPLSVNVFITLATQYNLEYPCIALLKHSVQNTKYSILYTTAVNVMGGPTWREKSPAPSPQCARNPGHIRLVCFLIKERLWLKWFGQLKDFMTICDAEPTSSALPSPLLSIRSLSWPNEMQGLKHNIDQPNQKGRTGITGWSTYSKIWVHFSKDTDYSFSPQRPGRLSPTQPS
jgi:hypothetical protein